MTKPHLNGYTPLMLALDRNHVDIARLLIEHSANVNARWGEGDITALMLACMFGDARLRCIRLLLDQDVDLNAQDTTKRTALVWAAKNGHTDTVRLLIERGADINMPTENPALIWAAGEGQTETVEVLLSAGADVNCVSGIGRTALNVAAWLDHTDTVRALLEHGADKDIMDVYGDTALSLAYKQGHVEIVELLRHA